MLVAGLKWQCVGQVNEESHAKRPNIQREWQLRLIRELLRSIESESTCIDHYSLRLFTFLRLIYDLRCGEITNLNCWLPLMLTSRACV